MADKRKTVKDSHDLNDKNTQWHMAFPSAIKLELMEYSQILDYLPEHLLNPKALQIDLLIIKKEKDIVIKNEVGRIFKQHNIIEYKSPHDKEGVNAYFKTYAYTSLYKLGEKSVSYEPEDITITMIREGKPLKLFKWFGKQGCKVDKKYNGIYYITGAGFFKTQIVVARELDQQNHIWLKSLTDSIDKQLAKMLVDKSRNLLDAPESEYVEAVLQIVTKANRKIFDEIKKEDMGMYRAFVELMQPEIDEAVDKRINEAVDKAVNEAVNNAVEKTWDEAVEKTWDTAVNETTAKNTVAAIENAMRKLNMSKKEACAFMDTTTEQYDAYKLLIKNFADRKNKIKLSIKSKKRLDRTSSHQKN